MADIGSVWATGSWVGGAGGWAANTWAEAGAGGPVSGDMNSRLYLYLCTFYSVEGDLTTMVRRYINEQGTGDMTQRFLQLIDDASA